MEVTQDESQTGRLRASSRWLILLGLVLLQGIFALWHLAGLQTVASNDTAYYYVVAKNIAHGKANPDNVLWTYFGKPSSVERPAGGYEGAGWPYALGTLMRLAGDSQIAALRICAVLSLFLPVLVFLLLERLNCRWWIAAFGAVLVCLQTKLFQTMVTPDITLSYQLTTTAGFVLLLGVLRGPDRPSLMRLLPCAFVLTLPMWLRGEAFILPLAATMGILAAPWPWRPRLRTVVGFAAWVGICVLPYVLYNVHFFGRITPEARSCTPLMTDYKQLYEFASQPSLENYCSLGLSGIVGLHIDALTRFVDSLPRNMPYLLLVTGIFGPLLWWIFNRRAAARMAAQSDKKLASNASAEAGRRQAASDHPNCAPGIITLWSFVVLSAAVPLLLAPIVSQSNRYLLNAIPMLCVLAVWTIGPLLRYRWTINLGLLFVAAFLLSNVHCPFHLRKPWTTAWKDQFLTIPTCLLPGNHPALNANDIVLTEMPWRVSAQLDVGSIMAPWDDTVVDDPDCPQKYQRFSANLGCKKTVVSADACRQVIEHYHPQFILAEDGSVLDQFVSRLKDLPLRVVCRGQNQDGRGYTWFAIGEGAKSKPE